MNKTFKRKTINGREFQLLTLPGTNLFKFEIINLYGANIEREREKSLGRNVYGLSHFVEHLAFRATKDFSTEDLLDKLKTEGSYNASTDHDRINYWFKTTMQHIDIGTRLVCNYALNDLTNIPTEEFNIEKKVVYNEAKRYADDDQTMFYFNTTRAMCGLHEEDNVIGTPETIDTFTHEDAINLKAIFLANGRQVHNITYDPTVMDEEEVLTKVNIELDRFLLPTPSYDEVLIDDDYHDMLCHPHVGAYKLENESEQAMTAIFIDSINHIWTASVANSYISKYATNTSLDDIIREQNGLTYGVGFYADLIGYQPYTVFTCDVSRGTEGQLMNLFRQSINASVDGYDQVAHEKLLKTINLKRTMRYVNQENYDSLFWMSVWYPYITEEAWSELATDLNATMSVLDDRYASFEQVGKYLENIRTMVNNEEWSIITN